MFCLFFFPVSTFATSWEYNASGTVQGTNGNILDITGSMVISDELMWHSGQPIEEQFKTGPYQYNYLISDFSLSVGEYSFSGSSGTIYFEGIPLIGDKMWWIEGSGDWEEWIGESFSFYNSDGTAYDDSTNDYCNLAPVIQFSHLDYLFDDQILSTSSPNLDLKFYRSSVPVPEPATCLLIVSGLFVGLFFRKKALS